ncbi:MAG: DMT family protein [Bacteroidales bacterium]|nr:DMT family protein [Bacteroidales bacterium]
MRPLYTVLLLVVANIFMTIAWYGHLKFQEMSWFNNLGLIGVIVISWAIAFVEYCFQVPANKYGYIENGGVFNLWQLKVLQEVITLTVFTLFTLIVFKNETLRWNHLVGFACMILAVYFIFKK